MITRLAVLLLCLATPALAEPLARSPRPGGNPRLTLVTPVSQVLPAAVAGEAAVATPKAPAPAEDAVRAPQIPAAPAAVTKDAAAPAAAGLTPGQSAAAQSAAPQGPRPKARPAALEARATELAALALSPGEALPRPRARPPVPAQKEPARSSQAAAVTAPAASASLAAAPQAEKSKGPTSFSRPKERPEEQKASANAPASGGKSSKKSKEKASARGSVCGVAAIKGEVIAPISSKVNGCGLADGVRVTSVSGVRLSTPATIDCTTAKALNRWVESVAQPVYGNQLVELKIAGHYICRPRNHKKGAKVSEHGRGRAIDVSGFKLASGKVLPVLKGFDAKMRKAHRGACGIFGTTLGPGSDGFHEDHLHFDTARHRSGAYCR